MFLNVNTDAAVIFSNKLEQLSKRGLPMAVFNTLNSAAFDLKMKTMPLKASITFKRREPNFFRANSSVEKASGFNIKTMKSTVGFRPMKVKKNFAIDELTQQERGGDIDHRSFVPRSAARVGNSPNGKVQPKYRLSRINKIIEARKIQAKSKRSQFVKAVHIAGKGGFVLGQNVLWKITSMNKKGKYKKIALYSFKKGRDVSIKPTGFMKAASLESRNKLGVFYIQNAKRVLAKYK